MSKAKLEKLEQEFINNAICPSCRKRAAMTREERQAEIDRIERLLIRNMNESEFVQYIEKIHSWRL